MGIGITQEHRELADAVRGLLAREAPPGKVRELLDAPPGSVGRPAHWTALAGQGLLGAHLPEAYGGGGGGLPEQAVILEEAGRAALPGPYLPTVLASAVLHRAGRPDLAAPLADGRRTGAVAFGDVSDPVLGGAEADLVLLRHEGAGPPWTPAVSRCAPRRAWTRPDRPRGCGCGRMSPQAGC